MRKKIIGLTGFLMLSLITFGFAQTITPLTSYTVSDIDGTCTSNGSITISVPVLTGSATYGTWTAQITRSGSNPSPVAQNVPSQGGEVIFNSLLPGNYSVLLTNGTTTLNYASNPVVITTSYVTMAVSATNTAPSCSGAQDGTLTVNIANNTGVGPFQYTVTSQFGTQTQSTSSRSVTFQNMRGGENVTIVVTDLVNNQAGCSTSTTLSNTIANPTLPPIEFHVRPYNFERDCSSVPGTCSNVKLFVNVLNVSTARLAALQSGGAKITINPSTTPQTFNLTYVGTINGAARFTYDPVSTGGPVLTNGTPISTTFQDGCSTLTRLGTVYMKDDFLLLQTVVSTDATTCAKKFQIRVLGDQDISQNGYTDRAVYFCQTNTLTFEKQDANGVFQPVLASDLSPDPTTLTNDLGVTLGVLIPSAVNTYTVPGTGIYRVTATDGCHSKSSVSSVVTVADSNPFSVVTVVETLSVLEGTSAMKINFPGLPPLTNPVNIRLERVDAQTSITLNPSNPGISGKLAGSYTYNFPMDVLVSAYPTPETFIGDLPLGEYKVTITDNCSATTGNSVVRTINLTNSVQYSPTINVVQGCSGSSSISFNMNPVNALNVKTNVYLYRKSATGGLGSLVATHYGALSGTFNNVPSGDFIIRYFNVRYADQSATNRNFSAATQLYDYLEYWQEVKVNDTQDFSVETSIAFCTIGDPNSGIVSAQINSGTVIYPVTFTLYETSNPSSPFKPAVTINSGATNAIFTDIPQGSYFVRVATACSSKDVSISVVNTNTIPQAKVSNGAVCPGSPTTLAAISATNNLYDISWEVKNSDGTYSPALDGSGNQLTGMPVALSPTQTTTYVAVFSLKTSFSCTNNTVYRSEVTVNVTDNPLLDKQVSDIDICLNPNPIVTISNSQPNFIYEILTPAGLSYSPKVLSAVSTGGNLSIAIPSHVTLTPGTSLKVSASNSNAGCSGILNDQVNILQSTANLSLNVEGSFVCVGSNGTIKVEGAESGVTYTVLKNGAPLSPSISNIGAGADLIFTIPAAQLNSATNTFTVQTSGANCATGVLAESGVITVQQAPSASTLIHAICGVQKGSITLSTFGGSGNYEYKLGSDGVWVSSNVFSDLNPGTYTVYSKDLTSGCESQNTIEILQYCLELTKVSTTNPNTYDSVGDVLTYNIIVKNTGNVPLSNIAVSDPGATLSSATISSLAVGASATLTASYNVNQADLDYGSFTNTANAQVIYNGVAVSASDSEIINASQVKSLNIIKTADKQNYALGDVITYTFAVKNTGNVTLGGISVADAMTGLSAISPTTVSSLAPGATSTFTATYTATQADVDAGKIENTATATGTFNSLNYTDSDTETILAVQNPSVSITKTAITSSYSAEGQVISYTIKVINDGDVTLSNIILNDPLTGLSQTILSLAPGANQEFSTSYTTNSADLSLTKIDNTATASYTFNGINHAEEDIASVPNANSINGLDCGANSYSIANGIATNIMVKVPYAGGTASTYLQGQAINLNNGTLTATLQAGTINPTGGELVYQLSGTPANASQVTLPVNFGGSTCQVIIYITEPNQSSISTFVLGYNDKNNNCVKDSGENEEGLPINGLFIKVFDLNNNLLTSSEISYGQFDILDLNINSDVIYYYIIDTNDSESDIVPTLPIGWSSGMGAPNLKRYFHFDGNILLQNTAPVANLVDPSWDGLTYPWRVCLSQAAGTIDVLDCASTKFSGVLAVNQVADGRSFTINYTGGNGGYYAGQTISSTGVSGLTATLVAGSLNAGSGTLTFSLSGKPLTAGIGKFNLTVGGKSCEISFTVEEPSFSVSKTIANSNYKSVGEVLNYNISVTNTGKIDLNNLIVKDPLTGLNQTITSLLAGANQTIATTYTVTQSDIDVGKIINKASATLSFGGQEYSEEAIAEIEAIKAPAINLTKTANKTSYTSVGDVITYTIVVNNTGNVTLSSVKVTDPLTAFDNTISTLAVGASQSFTTSYTVTQSDLDAGQIINIATGSYNYEGLDQEEKATATVLATRNPAIEITKVAAQTSFSKIGDVLNYTITLKNTGNVTLSNIIVTDPLTGMSETINSLAPNATRSFTTNYSITQSDLIAGKVDNTAKANLTYAGVDLVKTVTETVNGVKSPDLSIVKEAVQSNFEKVGDVLNYIIRVKNEGNTALVDIKVSDPLTGMNETIANLAVGESRVFTTSYTVTQLDINAEKIDNTAVASFTYSGTYYMKSASVTVPLAELKSLIQAINDNYADRPINVLETSKSGNVLANDLLNGQVIRPSDVNITVLNNGGLSGLIIDEDGYLVVPKGSPAGSYVVRYRICERVDPSNCSEANVILEVFHGVNLRIFKSVTSATWFEGNELEYQIRVENNGRTNATDVIAVDNLPEGLRYVSSKIANSAVTTRVNDQRISWTIPALARGENVEITLRVKVAPLTNGMPKTIVNIAQVSSKEMEMTPVDNSALATVRIDPFFIPNTITPNGDLTNDTFEIPGLNRFVSNELIIFNRWNDHVYQRKDYKNDWAAQGLVSGTYFYILKVKDEAGKTHDFKGYIQVVKESIR